jgi:hypothetical protein
MSAKGKANIPAAKLWDRTKSGLAIPRSPIDQLLGGAGHPEHCTNTSRLASPFSQQLPQFVDVSWPESLGSSSLRDMAMLHQHGPMATGRIAESPVG